MLGATSWLLEIRIKQLAPISIKLSVLGCESRGFNDLNC